MGIRQTVILDISASLANTALLTKQPGPRLFRKPWADWIWSGRTLVISNPKKTNSVHIWHRGIREDSSKKQKIEDIPLTKAKKKKKRILKKKVPYTPSLWICDQHNFSQIWLVLCLILINGNQLCLKFSRLLVRYRTPRCPSLHTL